MSQKKQIAKRKAAETERKFFKYAIIITLALLVVIYLIFRMNNQ